MAAKFHYGSKQPKAMLAALDRLPSPEDRVDFLLGRNLMEYAAPIMIDMGTVPVLCYVMLTLYCRHEHDL